MTAERITTLTAPPIVGQVYLVPTIMYPGFGGSRLRAWPVFLPKHEDKEHLNFAWLHYHVDPRFLSRDAQRQAARIHQHTAYDDGQPEAVLAWSATQARPLHWLDDGGNRPHPAPAWVRLKCRFAAVEYQHAKQPTIVMLAETFAGRQCRSSAAGWLCPHKKFVLGSIPPDANGLLTCPLHGLQIDAATGIVAGRASERGTGLADAASLDEAQRMNPDGGEP